MVAGRSRLRLWYHQKPEFDLARMFPSNELIPWVHEILNKTVVEEVNDCLESAQELLQMVDRAIDAIQVGGRQLMNGLDRRCRVCGIGHYTLKIDGGNDPASISGFGITPVGQNRFKVFACSHCGHVDLFFFETDQIAPAWRRPGGIVWAR